MVRRDLRLASGLVLFAYVSAHLANHALGLVSLAAAESGLRMAIAVWHSLPGTLLLYSAAAAHVTLAFLSVYERRTLRLPPAEVLRIALGFGMPILLIGHAVATRLAFELYGHAVQYASVVNNLWTSDNEGRQLALLAPGWIHGCMGLYFAFGHRPLWQRLRYVLFAAAVLLPVLAGLGFVAMAREIAALAADPAWRAANVAIPDPAERVSVGRTRDSLLALYFGLLAAVFAAREIRRLVERGRRSLVALSFPGRTLQVPRGWSVLEASRGFAIAHASACGGRARCSTCRVRITAGAEHCPEPGEAERVTLASIGAASDVRLACQLRPVGDIAFVPLVAPQPRSGAQAYAERAVALLSAEFCNRAELTRGHLPQDTLYLLNLYVEAVGSAVRAAGGVQCGASGERYTAVFGLNGGQAQACRQALVAAAGIEASIARLNTRLEAEWGAPARVSVSLHAGDAAFGAVGEGDSATLTAAGEAVDAAVRIHNYALQGEAHFVISQRLLEIAGVAGQEGGQAHAGALPVRMFRSVKSLAASRGVSL